jgi:hypothetical protein
VIPSERRYFVREERGAQSGPFLWYQLRAKLRTKQIAETANVREEETNTWFPLAQLVAEREPEERERARGEVEDAIADARRRGKKHLAYGIGCLGVGIVLTW